MRAPHLEELPQLLSELSQITYSINGAGGIVIDKTPPGCSSPTLRTLSAWRSARAARLTRCTSGSGSVGKREGPGRRGSVVSTTAQIGSLCFHGLFRHGRGGASTVKKSLPEPPFKPAAF